MMYTNKAILFRKKCSFNILILKNFIENIWGKHYPIEIIHLINASYLELFNPNLSIRNNDIYIRKLNNDIISVSCGCSHTVAIIRINNTKNGDIFTASNGKNSTMTGRKLYSWGDNSYGQLGLADDADRNLPTEINLDDVREISCGFEYNMAMTTDGTFYSWVRNKYGKLGMVGNSDRNLPVKINLDNIMSISCGSCHTIIITTDGSLYSWGRNDSGQLGLGDTHDRNLPVKINLDNILSVSCGDEHTMAVTIDGGLYSWGLNDVGELGLGDFMNRNLPTKINLNNILEVSCGYWHTIAITVDDLRGSQLYSWGWNEYGQLGLGGTNNRNLPEKINLNNISEVNCGHSHTTAVATNGLGQSKLYQWGADSDNKRYSHDRYNKLPEEMSLDNILSVSCGETHTVAATTDNKLYSWGWNGFGQLGLGDENDRELPEEITFKF